MPVMMLAVCLLISRFLRFAMAQTYAREVNALLDEIINISPPKSGSKGQIFKLWGHSKADKTPKRIDPPDGIQIIPFGFGGSKPGKPRKG
jgi:hypothetical protein